MAKENRLAKPEIVIHNPQNPTKIATIASQTMRRVIIPKLGMTSKALLTKEEAAKGAGNLRCPSALVQGMQFGVSLLAAWDAAHYASPA